MIVSVTPNTSMDYIVFVKDFPRDKTIRATRTVESIGGKATDASWILGELGMPSLALGFKAGRNGELIESFLHAKGVTTDFIPVEGESRRNLILISEEGWQTAITTSSLYISEAQIDILRQKYLKALETATVIVLGGTLPQGMKPEFYTEFIRLARKRGVPVVFDAAEPNLSAGLQAQPNYIKPNKDELSGIVGRPIESLEDAYAAARMLLDRYGTAPVITLGSMGGLAVLPDRAYYIPTIPVQVVNAAGAGDAVLAGITASLHRGQPIEDGLRLGFAAAAATVIMPGTAELTRADVERFLPQVELTPFEGVNA